MMFCSVVVINFSLCCYIFDDFVVEFFVDALDDLVTAGIIYQRHCFYNCCWFCYLPLKCCVVIAYVIVAVGDAFVAAVVNVVFVVDVAVVIVASVEADVDVNCNLQTSIIILLSFSSVRGYSAAHHLCVIYSFCRCC